MIKTLELPKNANVKRIKNQLANLLRNNDTEFVTLDYGDYMIIICHGGTDGSTTCEADILAELGKVYSGKLVVVSCHPKQVSTMLQSKGIQAITWNDNTDTTHVLWRNDNTIDLVPTSEIQGYKSSTLDRAFDYASWIDYLNSDKGK